MLLYVKINLRQPRSNMTITRAGDKMYVVSQNSDPNHVKYHIANITRVTKMQKCGGPRVVDSIWPCF